ncbi:MAG: CvfB family protein [Fusobacteriota bacterium]
MIKLGKKQKLEVSHLVDFGAYLTSKEDEEEEEILLPKNQMPEDLKEGDLIDVFIYKDSEDRLIATCKEPEAEVGDLAWLEVKDNTDIGTFLYWGLEKDLFVPFEEQNFDMKEGNYYLVYVYVDEYTERLCATTRIYDYLSSNSDYKKNDMVDGTVYKVVPEIGAFVAIDDKYFGLIPKNEYFKNLKGGQKLKDLRVIRVREDGKLDVTLRKLKQNQIDIDADMLYEYMQSNDGILELHDKSSPHDIRKKFKISKNAFKRAVGRLLKERKITKLEKGFKITDN